MLVGLLIIIQYNVANIQCVHFIKHASVDDGSAKNCRNINIIINLVCLRSQTGTIRGNEDTLVFGKFNICSVDTYIFNVGVIFPIGQCALFVEREDSARECV